MHGLLHNGTLLHAGAATFHTSPNDRARSSRTHTHTHHHNGGVEIAPCVGLAVDVGVSVAVEVGLSDAVVAVGLAVDVGVSVAVEVGLSDAVVAVGLAVDVGVVVVHGLIKTGVAVGLLVLDRCLQRALDKQGKHREMSIRLHDWT
jgi:hypothetical protein